MEEKKSIIVAYGVELGMNWGWDCSDWKGTEKFLR